jgi:hypothetical protein
MNSHHIATLIRLVSKAAINRDLSLETCSELNRSLWDFARKKGNSEAVDDRLREWYNAEAETFKAISEGRTSHSEPF